VYKALCAFVPSLIHWNAKKFNPVFKCPISSFLFFHNEICTYDFHNYTLKPWRKVEVNWARIFQFASTYIIKPFAACRLQHFFWNSQVHWVSCNTATLSLIIIFATKIYTNVVHTMLWLWKFEVNQAKTVGSMLCNILSNVLCCMQQ